MSKRYVITPASKFTDEDAAIINSQDPDTMAGMLVASTYDSILFGEAEWNRVWAEQQQWELDNVY
jgi:hypothetical protein